MVDHGFTGSLSEIVITVSLLAYFDSFAILLFTFVIERMVDHGFTGSLSECGTIKNNSGPTMHSYSF